ncbi:hypothetical protein S83_058477 [Arachis hypogaea]
MDKRIWRDEETEAFVGFMEEFVVDGQKADYRQLKPETFEKLALKMLEAFPNYTLTTKHCKNKHKRLKEKYYKDVLDAWMKAHPTKFYTPGKPFPLFHQLEGIFGKDRATGAGAVSGFDAEEQVDEEIEDQTQGFYDSDMSANPTIDRGQGQASHSNVGAGPGNTRHSSRKRRQTDLLERMAEHIQQSSVTQSQNAQLIADALVGVNGKFKIGEKLEQLGFREDEVVQVVLKFSENPHLCAHFWGLIDSQKSALVRSIIF